jgi:hypothetical protein
MPRRRRVVIAVLAGLIVGSAVFAVAASLGVVSSDLGAGTDSVASCDASVATSYDTAYDATLPGYEVTTVHVTGIATPACDGKQIKVTLANASNASLGQQSATLATPAADPALDFSASNISAENLANIFVVISG